MSTFILCPEPGISSFFRRMTAQLRVFFSRNNLSYYSCQRQDYWPFFAIFNVRYWSLMLSAFR
ncbi:hypothetical protein AM270_22400, partial [Escherichia coli]